VVLPITETLNDFYQWHIEIMPKLFKVARCSSKQTLTVMKQAL